MTNKLISFITELRREAIEDDEKEDYQERFLFLSCMITLNKDRFVLDRYCKDIKYYKYSLQKIS